MQCRKCSAELPENAIYCHLCGTKQEAPKKGVKRRGNGQGSAYKRGKTWTAAKTQYRAGERKVIKKCGLETKKAALEWLATAQNEKKEISTIEALYRHYEETALQKLSKSKREAYAIAYKKIPHDIALRPIQEITIANLQAIVEGMSYYPARDVKIILSHVYKRACAQGDVPSNIAQYIELPKLEEAEQRPFEEAEINQLWEAYIGGDTFIGYILLMIYSGMMPGELLACTRDMIDLEKQVIIGAGKKTKKRKETPIALADCIVPVVAAICGETKLIHINKDRFYQEYYAALERAGVRKLPPYSCRHTTATALASKVPPSIVQKVMRHATFSTTQRYIHHSADQTISAVNSITPPLHPNA